MKDIWLISDHHFGQESILSFKRDDGELLRPGFSNITEMNDFMLEQHNSVVKDGDVVWLLGDLYHRSFQNFFSSKYSRQMKGKLRIIPGNHDNINKLVHSKRFGVIKSTHRMDEHGLILSHVPLDKSSCHAHRIGRDLINVHGHIHYRDPPSDRHFNVSVERNNYLPFNLDEIILDIST